MRLAQVFHWLVLGLSGSCLAVRLNFRITEIYSSTPFLVESFAHRIAIYSIVIINIVPNSKNST